MKTHQCWSQTEYLELSSPWGFFFIFIFLGCAVFFCELRDQLTFIVTGEATQIL